MKTSLVAGFSMGILQSSVVVNLCDGDMTYNSPCPGTSSPAIHNAYAGEDMFLVERRLEKRLEKVPMTRYAQCTVIVSILVNRKAASIEQNPLSM